MSKPLRALIVEDSKEDTLLLIRQLKYGGFDPIHEQVETAEGMKAALEKERWDLIIADYTLPHFSAPAALEVLKESGLDIPFIIVSGNIGEDIAVTAMKAGAHDYLMKNDLARLIPAIEQELREAEVKQRLKHSEKSLQESEKRYREVVENATEIIYTVDEKGNFTYANPAGLKATGYSLQELRKLNYADLVLPDRSERVKEIYVKQFREKLPKTYVEFPFFSKAGEIIWFGQNSTLVIEGDKILGFHIIARDITERKRTEEALRESEKRFKELFDEAPVGYHELDKKGRIIRVNRTELEMLGYSVEEMVGQPVWNFIAEEENVREVFFAKVFGRVPPGRAYEHHYIKKYRTTLLPVLAEDRLLRNEKEEITGLRVTIQDITERKRAEELLQESEKRYRDLVENSQDLICTHDLRGNFLSVNAAAAKLFGYNQGTILNMNVRDILAPEVRDEFSSYLDTIQKEGLAKGLMLVQSATGERRILEYNNTLRTEGLSSPIVRSINHDITERRQAEQALQESEERYRVLVETSPDAIVLFDLNLNVIMVNRPALRLFGSERQEDVIRRNVLDSLAPEQLARAREDIGKVLETGSIGPVEYRLLKQDGTSFVAELKASLILDREKKPSAILCVSRDITERKKAEEALQKSENRYRLLAENVTDIIWTADMNLRYTYISPSVTRMRGYSVTEAIYQTVEETLTPSSFEVAMRVFAEELAKEQSDHKDLFRSRTLELEENCKDGSTVWTESTMTFLRESDGRPVGILGITRDITERRKAEEALRQEKDFNQTLVQASPLFFVAISPDGKTLMMNEAMLHALGYTTDQVVGKDYLSTFIPMTDREMLLPIFQKLVNQMESTFNENRVLTKDGRELLVEWHGRPVLKANGDLDYFFGVGIDITQRRQVEEKMASLQEQLRQSQKIEAIGRLAGGIAHDFNNLLTVISGNCQLSLLELKEDVPLKGNIEEIKRASEKAADLTRQLLAFSRRQIMETKVLDLNAVLRDLDKMLHRLIGEDIELTTLLADDLGSVKTDPGWVEQIIMNLAVNARDAMPNGGKLTIETANVELDEAYAFRHIAVRPGRYVMLSMSDTGVGMTPEVKQQVFDPFFTTKERGKGTGLGLSTVYGIVKQSGGNIWVYSEPGKGSTFKIYLPRVDEPAEELKQKAVKGELPRGNETIFIVEDEKEVLTLAARILRRQGYSVLEASGAEEALKVCKERKEPFHLLVTDVVMPQMSGRQLAEQLKQACRDFKILYMSGYTDDAITHHGVLEKGMNYLQKPFTIDGLAKKVREVLDKA